MTREIPEGFEPMPEGLGFTDILQPLYRRERDGRVALGMFVQKNHTNMLNICHGGVLMTLADVAAASGVNYAREKPSGAPTINLSFDFIAAARVGDWLQAEADRVTVKRRFGFSSGVVESGERIIMRFSGNFYLPEHGGFKADLKGIARMHGQG
jgi:uncharacterized protein (TIGR00369 family)